MSATAPLPVPCRGRVLPHNHPDAQGLYPPCGGKFYACHMAHKLLDFRHAELESLASLYGCKPEEMVWIQPESSQPEMYPIWHVSLPSDEVAQQVAARSMLTKGFYEVWGQGSTWEELVDSIQAYPEDVREAWLSPDLTFKVNVERFGGTLTPQEQVGYIERLHFVNFKGRVNLKKPQVTFWLMIVDIRGTPGVGDISMMPFRFYFGRQVAVYNHQVSLHYTLKQRPYIGPTSMDAEMAFVMCNQAKVHRGALMFDPYVGTGSIGVAAAYQGAHVMGMDIDIRVVRLGKKGPQGQTLDVYANFDYYGTSGRLAGLVRGDMHRHPFRNDLQEVFHAIVGDPPYGVRAGGRKSRAKDIEIRDRETFIPGTDPYSFGECLRDLWEFAARTLTIGGRLVLFIPATPETYREEEIPTHPMLRLIYNSEQMLTLRYSRRLITLEKVQAYDAAAAARHHEAHPDPTMSIDKIHDIVYESYERDEKGNIIYPEGALNNRKYRSKRL